MLKKLSKSRKKNPSTKLANSRNKQPLDHRKEVKQQKQAKNLNKNNHHSSTLTLLNHHNLSHISHASQSSLLGLGHGNSVQAGHGSHTGDKYGAKKAKSKNRQSSISLIYRQGKDVVGKSKEKEKDRDKQKEREKQKNKNVKETKKQKSKKNSGLNQNSKTKKNISRISPQKMPQRQKIFINNKKKPQQEIYERINLGIFKSKTNSEINFSNNSSVRQNNAYNVNLSSHLSPDHNASNFYLNSQIISNKNKKPLTIDCSDQYIISHYFSNSRIKNQDKKRTEAAIKIQKVFRGYLTRKMLEQYIQKQQQRLIKLAQKIKRSSSRQSEQISIAKIFENSKISHEVQKSQQPRNRSLTQNRQKQTSKKPSTDLFFDDHYDKSTNELKEVESKQYKSSTQLIQEQEFYLISLKNSRRNQHPIDHDALLQQSSIYGQAHDSISQYIPYQQKQVINQLQDQSEIIEKYTTEQIQRQRQSSGKKSFKNEQYYTYQQAKQLFSKNQKQKKEKQKDQISSSKQSQQLFKCTPAVSSFASRSSRQKIQEPMPTDFSDKKIGEFSSEISSKSKQLLYNQGSYNFNYNIRTQNGEGQAESYENLNFPRKKEPLIKNLSLNTIDYEDDQNVIQVDIQNRKHPENNESIKKQLNQYIRKTQKQLQSQQKQKKQISLLKKVQKQKWSKIIQMLNRQILENKQKSQENQKFMNIILQFSKKNKQQLQKSFTDVFSNMEDHQMNQDSMYEKLQHLHSFKKNKNQLENNTIDDRELYKQISQQSSIKNVQIKRKNNIILFKKPPKNTSNPTSKRNEEQQQLSLPDPKFRQNSPPHEQDSSNFSLYNIKQQSYNISSSLLQDSQQKQQEEQQEIRENLKKNLDLPFVRKKITNLNLNLHNCHAPTHQIPHSYPHHYPSSNKQNFTLLQKTQQLKNFYRKNHAVYPIQQMIQIREKALEEREKLQLNRLNQDLASNRLSHEQFIGRLSQMQEKFQHERQQINQAKLQIFIGYRATHKLMHDSVKDAWYLGFKIPFSQSMKDFKSNNNGNLWIKDIIVDELKSFSNIHQSSSNETKNKKKNVTAQKVQRKGHQYRQLQIQLNNSSSQIKQRQQYSLESISNKLQTSQIKKEDLSISLPYEDSSLMKQNHEISQHSLYSEDMSYNEGQIQLNNLQNINGKAYLFEDQINQQDSQENQNTKYKKQQQWYGEGQQESVKGFRKMQGIKNQPINRMAIKIDLQNQRQNLIIDPSQQKEVDNEIMRKISINPLKKQNRQQFQLELNMHNIKKYELESGADSNMISKSPRLLYNRNKNNVRSQIYKVDLEQEQSSSDQEVVLCNEELDPEIKQITQLQISNLIWEVTSQIYLNLHMRSKLCRNRNKMPDKIETNERMELINFLLQQIPCFQLLLPRINQKMTASRLELLKFMRVSFQDEDQFDLVSDQEDQSSKSDGFEQIGKFEHILSAEICLSAMNKCLQEQQLKQSISYRQKHENGESAAIQNIKKALQGTVSAQVIKKVIERQKLNKYNQMQKNDLRKQIKKVQYHCIFDSFNELIMKKRLKLSGYSGIGLNQLSLAMKNQECRMIKQENQFKQILDESVKQLRDLVGDQKTSNQKLVMQNYQRLCQNDSQWICYSDQALSFALQFVYMLQDEIFFQETALIFKKIKLR